MYDSDYLQSKGVLIQGTIPPVDNNAQTFACGARECLFDDFGSVSRKKADLTFQRSYQH